ncbi:MAG TPA: hypothetical protein VNM45_06615 [Bacillus sp. (in: firmicutes)]|nr:hypothetical protein [Bacillus sp. (in: firmicutes)]
MVTYENMDEQTAYALIATLGVFSLFIVIIGLIIYVLSSYSVMKLAQNAGIENGWFAFIPILNIYLYGELISAKLGGNGGVKLLIAYAVGIILNLIPIINIVASIALFVFGICITYWLFQRFTDKAVLYTVLSFLTGGIAYAICLYMIRKNSPLY